MIIWQIGSSDASTIVQLLRSLESAFNLVEMVDMPADSTIFGLVQPTFCY